jgi:hypothetical protein
MVRRSLLAMTGQELVVILVAVIAAASSSLIAMLQINADGEALGQWKAALVQHEAVYNEAKEMAALVETFFNASLEALSARRRVLKGELTKVEAAKAKMVSQAITPAPRDGGVPEHQQRLWLQVARGRLMRAGCPAHRDAAAHYSELLDALNKELIIVDAHRFAQVKAMLDRESLELEELSRVAAKTFESVRHMEGKMATIAALWPRWFTELQQDEPIYRPMFGPDAKVYHTHDQGVRDYLKRTGKWK